eukprot:Gregarina_sp_Pseudo_9__3182@NODE_336_length_3123_cov_19_521401_g316_i0_p2_GENE_NODE_336_length_3123_cov_19_521401_g316_i0NODE_336_length_3123_cov_19_521401_g316_i0_p2_ORF_typecomplete_len344_score64_04TPT/PF03151_16/3_7e39EamA/PF00892_20/4_5e08EamA/PF00892_20/2_3e06UAA/PF08449_11/4_7e13CRTlike/PF08627_10/5_4e10CRTlike/PF08627_10/0_005SLC35F/PF06027_12/2_2e03SLC35F/PF06027_12/1e09Nuc_sug_transp/PF04142_15/3_1e05Nuc_sug_transp/PF04142_15/0_0017PUNUT/PF16913_5/1_5e07DUF3792/PF12670_7/0_00011DUF3792
MSDVPAQATRHGAGRVSAAAGRRRLAALAVGAMSEFFSESSMAPVTRITTKHVAFCVYTVSSAAFILCNRGILLHHRRPLSVTCYQQAVVLSCYAVFRLLAQRKAPFSLAMFPVAAPCSVLFLSMVALNNFCLSYTSVAGYVIARASTIIFNLLLSRYVLHKRPSLMEWLACVIVASAVFFGGKGTESSLEVMGLVTGVLASFSQAAFSCLIARTFRNQPHVKPYDLLGHYTAITVAALGTALYFGIEPSPADSAPLPAKSILLIGLVNAIVAFSALSSLSMSNPVTVNLLGYLKSTVQAFLGCLIFHDKLSVSKSVALTLTIAGSVLYSIARQKETVKKRAD